MREASERLLCDEFQRFVAIKGTAENTSLSDLSVNHIVCAHSFHNFDLERCKNEFARILKPSGTVNLIWNKRLVECDEFSKEYESLIQRYASNLENKDLKRFNQNEFSRFFGSDCYSVVSLPNQQNLDLEGIKGRLLSDDLIPSKGEDGFVEMINELEYLFNKFNQCGKITMRYETEAYAGRFNIA
jgi:ubiquinone/menaquinone biosynthesis C-methylase UbiE